MQESAPRRKLTPEDKKTILDLASQGWEIVQIARHLNINGQAVNGLVSTARKRGIIPPRSSQPEPLPPLLGPETLPMAETSATPAGAPAAVPHVAAPAAHPPIMHSVPLPASQPQVARDGGFSGGRPVVADPGGFISPQSELRWTVERIVPPDGVLGTHYGPLTIEDVAQIYGGDSTYKVVKFENGRAMEFTKRVGSTYGPPRNPKNQSQQVQRPDAAAGQGAAPSSPTPQRPFFQVGQDPMGGAGMFPPQRPFFPPYTPAPAADQSVATEALKQMGEQNRKILEQQEKSRQNGPDQFIVQLMQSQQENWNQRWEQERKRDEERRKAEEEKYERRQREEAARIDRERQASADAHTRELQRIKAESDARMAELRMQAEERERRVEQERKFLLDLEDKRIQVIKQEAEINQKRLEAELQRSREEMKSLTERTASELMETRQATRESIQASQSEMNERLQREREQLDRMHSLREKALDREHELQRDMLSLQRENIQKDGGDQLYNMLQTVFKEASKGFEKLVDLKKIQALTPEAQAAAIQRGAIDGNIGGGAQQGAPQQQAQQPQPHRQPEPEPVVQPRPAAAVSGAQRPGQNGSGQPAAAPVAAAATADGETGGNRMLALFRQAMETEDGRKFFGSVMEEWALHIEVGNDPSVFTTFFLEMLRDENNAEVRKAATFLYTLMAARPWKKMYPIFKPYMPEAIVPVMDRQEAEQFYEAFRAMVYAQMQGYYANLLQAATPAAAAQAQPAPQAQPQAPAAPAPQQPVAQEEPPAPPAAAPVPAPEPRFRTVS